MMLSGFLASLRARLWLLTTAVAIALAASCGGKSEDPGPPASSTDPCRNTSSAPATPATKQPADQTVYAGDSATFQAPGGDAPGASVRWQLSTNDGATWADVAGAASATLVVETAGYGVAWYRAIVSVGSANSTSDAAKLTAKAACLSLLAGQVHEPASPSDLFADASGSQARFNQPASLASDAADNVYVADTGNHVIRKITPGGTVTTLAGLAGEPGNADGAGTDARFREPRGVAVDATGNVYVADTGNNALRLINPDGRVSTVVTMGPYDHLSGVAVNAAGTAYLALSPGGVIKRSAAGATTRLFGTGSSNRVAVDASNNLYWATWGNTTRSSVLMISPDGQTLGAATGGPREAGPPYGYFMSPDLSAVASGSPGVAYVGEAGSGVLQVWFNETRTDGVAFQPKQARVVRAGSQADFRLGVDGTALATRAIAPLSGGRIAIATGNAVVIASWP